MLDDAFRSVLFGAAVTLTFGAAAWALDLDFLSYADAILASTTAYFLALRTARKHSPSTDSGT